MSNHRLLEPAKVVAGTLAPLSSGKLPQEILILDTETVAVVVEVAGVDYIMTMMEVPRQRQKPRSQ